MYDFKHPLYKPEKRREARKLRKEKGFSVNKIAAELHVSKGSVSVWVRDIPLTQKQKKDASD